MESKEEFYVDLKEESKEDDLEKLSLNKQITKTLVKCVDESDIDF